MHLMKNIRILSLKFLSNDETVSLYYTTSVLFSLEFNI